VCSSDLVTAPPSSKPTSTPAMSRSGETKSSWSRTWVASCFCNSRAPATVPSQPGKTSASVANITGIAAPHFLQCAGNDLLHDFIGPGIDTLHTGIGPGTCHWIFPHEAVAAMQLHALIENPGLQIGSPILEHRRSRDIQFALQMQLQAAIHEHPANLYFSGHFGQLEARILKVRHRLAERLALTGVVQRPF